MESERLGEKLENVSFSLGFFVLVGLFFSFFFHGRIQRGRERDRQTDRQRETERNREREGGWGVFETGLVDSNVEGYDQGVR